MNRVLCVVVTYNRLDCLKECLIALRNQTFKGFDILVVNNGSTDETADFLKMQSDIIVITQENLGSSGGQYAGMKYGFENGYEWLWHMDDDGLPAPNQLEELLKYEDESWSLNALVIDKEDHSKFSFPPHNKSLSISSIQRQPIVRNFVHPFNGTLYNRKLIEKIGYIKKDTFIWGDEKEYTARAIKAGFIPVTVTTAIHYHPKEKATKVYPIPFWHHPLTEVLLKPEKMSHYYYRNLGYIDATYRTELKSFKLVLIHTIYFLRTLKFKEMKKFYHYYLAGRRNDYE